MTTRILEQLSISRLKIYLLVTTIIEILNVVKKLTLTDPLIQKIIETLSDGVTKMQQFFDYQKTNKYTIKISEADEERENLFKSFTDIVSGITRRVKKPDEANAAKEVYEIIENYGVTLYKEGYKKQSFLLNGLLEDLKKPQIIAAIEKIKQQDLLDELRESQQNFEKLFDEKHEDAGSDEIPQVNELKKDLVYNLSALITIIDISASYKFELFLSSIPQINHIINDSMKAYRAEQTRKETNDKKDEDSGDQKKITNTDDQKKDVKTDDQKTDKVNNSEVSKTETPEVESKTGSEKQ